ncbi:MAG: hypothetical protein LBP28_01380, partial [Coriobacteriales bacterium]|nr:hypothetical protein [Coriobacteriales bacterium]
MDYTLMHKNIPVVDIVLDTYDGAEYVISQLSSAANPAHVPLGINVNGNDVDAYQLNRWWRSRRIPASRHGLDEALDNMSGEPDRGATSFLALSAYGLSLSDQYWICPKGSGLTWDKVNFFTNGFSPDVGEMLFGDHSKNLENIDLLSPDNTSDGVLKKKWIIAEGKRYLVKSGSGVYQQEPYNEAIATTLCRRLGINHIPYAVIMDNDRPCSICENFVTVNTELVPAARVYQSTRRDSKADSPYSHLLKCCDALGIPDVKPALDRMLVLDY